MPTVVNTAYVLQGQNRFDSNPVTTQIQNPRTSTRYYRQRVEQLCPSPVCRPACRPCCPCRPFGRL